MSAKQLGEMVRRLAFNSGEFAIVKSKAGLNGYKLSGTERVEKTNSIGICQMQARSTRSAKPLEGWRR